VSGARKTAKLVPGLIVRAEVLDSEGRNSKSRPLVLLTGEDDTPAGEPLIAVAISGTLPRRLPAHYVLLPWHRAGHPQTGLKKKCAAVCNWFSKVNGTESVEVMGRVPDPVFEEIRQKVRTVHEQQSQQP
jgi:mRNA-degrading endonuclease toxin of MazEF toxin-antitoxin module